MTTATYAAEKMDHSFPYVLVSSLVGALVSLAAVWLTAATTFASMVGA
jgi:hypothetical protein